jgi:hypothetical protein
MNKLLSTAAVTMLCATMASGQISINFDTSALDAGRIYDTEANALLGGTTGRLPVGTIVQLLWNSTSVIPDLDPFNPLVPTAGSILLNTTFSTAGRISDLYTSSDAGLVGGYVYARVFNAADPMLVGIGTAYLERFASGTGPLVLATPDPTTTLQFDITPGGSNIWLDQTVIPEPSVMALMGLGGLLMAIRRRRMIA